MSAPRGAWWSQQQTDAALSARQQAADAAVAGLDPVASSLRMGTNAPAELDGLDADAIKRLSMSSYAEIRRRAGLPANDPFSDAYRDYEPPGTPRSVSAPEATQANADAGLPDMANLSMSEYAQLRSQLGIGTSQKEGRGIFDSVGSRSDAYTNAVRQQAGRTAYSPETHHPGFARVFINENAQPVQGRQSPYQGA